MGAFTSAVDAPVAAFGSGAGVTGVAGVVVVVEAGSAAVCASMKKKGWT